MGVPFVPSAVHPVRVRPSGDSPLPAAVPVDTVGGRVHVDWDPAGAATPLGPLPFFVEYLKLGGLFDSWVGDCPLRLASPNAPAVHDILGTLV